MLRKSLIALWFSIFLTAPAWSQAVIRQLQTPRDGGEDGAVQVGGTIKDKQVVFGTQAGLQVLRCQGGEALVGMRIRRGSAINMMQIACAPITCDANNRCRWTQANFEASAGSYSGGTVTIDQTCSADAIVTGFRATTNFGGIYAYDVQIECSQVGNIPPTAFISGRTITPIQPNTQLYRQRLDSTTQRDLGDLMRSQLWSSCNTNGATAVPYFLGTYGVVNPVPVVQEFSMYCVGGYQGGKGNIELSRLATQIQNGAQQLQDMVQVAGDHFFFGVEQTVVGMLQFLAQPRSQGDELGVPAQQLCSFLSADNSTFNQNLLEMASQAINTFLTDPAQFFGQQAPALVGSKAYTAARDAAVNLRWMNKFAGEFGNFTFPTAGGPFNPTGSTTNCFRTAIAFDRSLANGRLFAAPAAPTMKTDEIIQILRSTYGKKGLAQYNSQLEKLATRQGIPITSDQARITQILKASGEGSRGLVFIRDTAGQGHIFNAFIKNGQVYFYDPQFARAAAWGTPRQIFFYRTN